MKMAQKQLDLTSDNTPIHHHNPWRLYIPSQQLQSAERTHKRSCVTNTWHTTTHVSIAASPMVLLV